MSKSWRQEVLADWDVDYVYSGVFEQQMAPARVEIPGELFARRMASRFTNFKSD